jgi:hypothetical protein
MPRTHLIRWIRETAIQLVRLHWEPRLYATLIITTSFVPNIRFPPLSPGCACRPFRTSRCTTVTPSSRIQRSRCTINGGRNGRSNSTTATLSVSMEGCVAPVYKGVIEQAIWRTLVRYLSRSHESDPASEWCEPCVCRSAGLWLRRAAVQHGSYLHPAS